MKPLEPGTGSLLETVESLHESANMIRTCAINETAWLLRIDKLLKLAM